jgi:hypothetical protein
MVAIALHPIKFDIVVKLKLSLHVLSCGDHTAMIEASEAMGTEAEKESRRARLGARD